MIHAWAGFVLGAAVFDGRTPGPQLTAATAVVYDPEARRVLWGKNLHTKRYPASTTKVLTALLLLEGTQALDTITAPSDTKQVTGSSLHLVPGEQITSEVALYALMLRSANDVAHAVAVQLAGSDLAFADKMNTRAKEIGCRDSFFRTPHGLNDDYHMTTAYDLALIASEAIKDRRFLEAVGTKKRAITRSTNQADLLLENRNELLGVDPTNRGIKTGYTNPAGKCFVGLNDLGGRNIVTVVMGSTDWKSDQTTLARWTEKNFKIRPVAEPGYAKGEAKVIDGVKAGVPIGVKAGVLAFASQSEADQATLSLKNPVRAPIAKGQSLGSAELTLGNGASVRCEAVALEEVKASFSLAGIARSPAALAVLACVSGLTVWMKARARRPVRRRRRRLNHAR